ncbi:MAG TPA: hypothetical protein VM408_07710 [Methylomirabilota bacterium]|nr:hypothetical protein [Methylomirabilota bacterium]
MTNGGAIRGLVIGLHVALVAVLAAISLPQVVRVKEQLETGYVPPYTELLVVLIALPLVLAGLMLRGLVLWWRGQRRFLISVDGAAVLVCWSVLIIFVMANDLPIAALVLAPAALLGAGFAPRTGSRGDPTDGEAALPVSNGDASRVG